MKNRLYKIGLFIVVVILGCLCVYGYSQKHQSQQDLTQIQGEIRQERVSNQHLIKAVNTPKYVVNSEGHMDYNAKATISKIKDLFESINNWGSASTYYKARQSARGFIKDPSFFKTYLKSYVDPTGDSEITSLHLKRRNNVTKVYEVRPGQYLVISSYYDYHNGRDFTQRSAMTDTKTVFMFYGDSYRISHVKTLNNLV